MLRTTRRGFLTNIALAAAGPLVLAADRGRRRPDRPDPDQPPQAQPGRLSPTATTLPVRRRRWICSASSTWPLTWAWTPSS